MIKKSKFINSGKIHFDPQDGTTSLVFQLKSHIKLSVNKTKGLKGQLALDLIPQN